METANTKGRRLTVRKDGVPCYDIVYRSSFEDLGQELAALGYTGRQICIVTDSNVGPLYGEEVRGALADICRQVPVCVLPAGESNKNLAQVERICRPWAAALSGTWPDLPLPPICGALILYRFPPVCWPRRIPPSAARPVWISPCIRI